jgi:hypothetical protein
MLRFSACAEQEYRFHLCTVICAFKLKCVTTCNCAEPCNPMGLSLSLQSASRSAAQEFHSVFWASSAHSRVHKNSPLLPNLSLSNPVRARFKSADQNIAITIRDECFEMWQGPLYANGGAREQFQNRLAQSVPAAVRASLSIFPSVISIQDRVHRTNHVSLTQDSLFCDQHSNRGASENGSRTLPLCQPVWWLLFGLKVLCVVDQFQLHFIFYRFVTVY